MAKRKNDETSPTPNPAKRKRIREPISKRKRFEVFKRDSFTCQYCGRAAPDVTLQVDHISPVSKGGANDVMNLVTSCAECNSGKSDRLISDDSVIARQRQQLAELNERREQLKMMLRWRDELASMRDDIVAAAAERWNTVTNGQWKLNLSGIAKLKKYITQYGLAEVLDAIDASAEIYLPNCGSETPQDAVDKCWYKVGGILRVRKLSADRPYLRDLYYIRGILRNRFSYVNERRAMELLEEAYQSGKTIDDIRTIAATAKNWTAWHNMMVFGSES